LIDEKSSHQFDETTPEITRDIQKSSQKSNRSKTMRNQKPIKSNNMNKQENIASLQW
jgi:hypothetical protein